MDRRKTSVIGWDERRFTPKRRRLIMGYLPDIPRILTSAGCL